MKSRHPLLLYPVMGRLFCFMGVEDIKACALVCQTLNDEARSILRKRGKIKLRKTANDVDVLQRFNTTFEDSLETMPFTAFKIHDSGNVQFTFEELNMFFAFHQKNITQLNLQLRGCEMNEEEESEEFQNFDVGQWISKSPLAKPNSKLWTKLELTSFYQTRKLIPLSIALDVLVHIKDLTLQSCLLKLIDGIKIHPVNLKLSVKFYKDENLLSEVIVNDFVDFSKSKKLELLEKNIILDLGERIQTDIDVLLCDDIQVINKEFSQWKIKTIKWNGSPFLGKLGAHVQEIYLQDSEIDLAALPDSIELLDIKLLEMGTTVSCSQPISYNNLKSVTLQFFTGDICSFLSHLNSCPSLYQLTLKQWVKQYGRSFSRIVNLNWIPSSVKILKLDSVSILEEQTNLVLDTLILYLCPFKTIQNIPINNIRAKDLVLYFDKTPFQHDLFVHSLEQIRKPNLVNRIFAGPFSWTEERFGESPMTEIVQTQSEYYEFSRNFGQEMLMEEHTRLCKLF